MSLRTAHGNQATRALVVVETPPIDELADGVPAPSTAPQPARDAAGRYQAGHPATVEAARAAGRSRRARAGLAHTLAVDSKDPAWQAYLRQAEAFRRAQVRLLADAVGGGTCGPAPAALVASAALALAGSRYLYSQGDLPAAARLAAEVRSNLLGAHELCAREATARREANPGDAHAAALAAFGGRP
jgi:hypothetical protein